MGTQERELPNHLWLTIAGLATFTAAVLGHAWTIELWPKDLWWLVDAETYRAGGEAARSGTPLYDHGVYGPLLFTYTPFAAVCFIPLTLISMAALRLLATAGNLGALLIVVWMCWGYLGYKPDHGRLAATFLVGGFAFWLEPVRTTVLLGQINLLLLVLVLADFVPNGRRWSKGLGVGLAAAIKLTPLIFVAYFLVTRRFKAAAVSLAIFAATVLIGFAVIPADSVKYWTGVFTDSSRVGNADSTGNQSIDGLLARELHAQKPPMLLWVALSALVAVAGLLLARWAHRNSEELLAVTLVGLTGTLVSPMSWTHHWVWTIPLLVIGIHLALTRHLWMWLVVAAYWLAIFPWIVGKPGSPHGAPPNGITQIPEQHHPLRTMVFDSLYVWIALIVFAAAAWHLTRASNETLPPTRAIPDRQLTRA